MNNSQAAMCAGFKAALTKIAAIDTMPKAALRGAAIGAGVSALYGGAKAAYKDSEKAEGKRKGVIRSAFGGAIDALPKGAVIGGLSGIGHHGYKRGVEAYDKIKDAAGHWAETGQAVGDTARQTAESVRKTEAHLADIKEKLNRVATPVGDALAEWRNPARKKGFKERFITGRIANLFKDK